MKMAGKNFSNTESPCMDGILSNIDYAGCKSINISQIPGEQVYRVRCSEYSIENQWTTFTFYFVSHDSMFHRADWSPVCMDPTTNIFYVLDPNIPQGISTGTETTINQKTPGSCFSETDETYRLMTACEFENVIPESEDHCYQAWIEKYRLLFTEGCAQAE